MSTYINLNMPFEKINFTDKTLKPYFKQQYTV